MAAGAGTERCSCVRRSERAGSIPALRKRQHPPCKPNKRWPVLGVLTPPVFVLTGCRAQGNRMGSKLPPSPSSACREGLLQVCPFPAPCKGRISVPPLSMCHQGCTHTRLRMLFCRTTNPGTFLPRFLLSGRRRETRDTWQFSSHRFLLCWRTQAVPGNSSKAMESA